MESIPSSSEGFYDPVSRSNFRTHITSQLRDSIVQGKLSRGTRLVETALAERFGVSRGPIRESLRELEGEGLVEVRHPGTYVVGVDADDIQELYALRGAVEQLAIQLAIDRTVGDQWLPLLDCVQRMEEAAAEGNATSVGQEDARFHEVVYILSGNKRLFTIWQHYVPILSALLRATIPGHGDLGILAENHRRLCSLIVAGDREGAESELRDHLADSQERMLRAHREIR